MIHNDPDRSIVYLYVNSSHECRVVYMHFEVRDELHSNTMMNNDEFHLLSIYDSSLGALWIVSFRFPFW